MNLNLVSKVDLNQFTVRLLVLKANFHLQASRIFQTDTHRVVHHLLLCLALDMCLSWTPWILHRIASAVPTVGPSFARPTLALRTKPRLLVLLVLQVFLAYFLA